MIRVGVVGGTGKLGKDVIDFLLENKQLEIGAVITRKNNQYVGCDIGILVGRTSTNLTVTDDVSESVDHCDIYIDCTNADAFDHNYEAYLDIKKPIILATTGLSESTQEKIRELSKYMPILICPNFSVGVYLFLKLIQYTSQILDSDMDIEIIESHHNMKKDIPSGTALKIAEIIAKQRGIKENNIPIHSIRAGSIVGEHSVIFVSNEDERIELSHKLFSRKGFAKGILLAVKWIRSKENGLYGLEDIF